MPTSTIPPAPWNGNNVATEKRPAFAILFSCAGNVGLVPVERAEVVVGRVPECDVVVADPSVSRRHVLLRFGDEITIEDLGSRNGTSIAGQRLPPGKRVPVGVGAVIELGSATLVIQSARELVTRRAALDASASGDARPIVDPTMQRLYAMLDVIAPTTLSVLILGETGSGKEVFAEALHARSLRASRPFLRLNCAALAESVLESELFGHDKGAFTGATRSKEGLFEAASGGTIFLDEISDMAIGTQAKLLRVLETGEVMRLGSTKKTIVDVRIVSATNADPQRLVADGRFRADLYFRINGISVTLPPLRERRAEIIPLASYFLRRGAEKLGRAAPALTDAAIAALEAHSWPGNVRELRNVIERAVALCRARLDVEHLFLGEDAIGAPESPRPNARAPRAKLREEIDAFEKQRLVDALARTGNNQVKAAQLLRVSRRTLINKMEAFGIERPRKGKSR